MNKENSYFQGLYLDINFLISENINFDADILVNIFCHSLIFFHILFLCLNKMEAYDHLNYFKSSLILMKGLKNKSNHDRIDTKFPWCYNFNC